MLKWRKGFKTQVFFIFIPPVFSPSFQNIPTVPNCFDMAFFKVNSYNGKKYNTKDTIFTYIATYSSAKKTLKTIL